MLHISKIPSNHFVAFELQVAKDFYIANYGNEPGENDIKVYYRLYGNFSPLYLVEYPGKKINNG